MIVRSAIWREARLLLAIALGYVLVAQLMLAGTLGGQIAAAGPDVAAIPICYGSGKSSADPDQPDKPPLRSAPCTLCASTLCSPVAATAGAAIEFLPLVSLRQVPAAYRSLFGAQESRSRFSRGPPTFA
jgi:hypothetical protein